MKKIILAIFLASLMLVTIFSAVSVNSAPAAEQEPVIQSGGVCWGYFQEWWSATRYLENNEDQLTEEEIDELETRIAGNALAAKANGCLWIYLFPNKIIIDSTSVGVSSTSGTTLSEESSLCPCLNR